MRAVIIIQRCCYTFNVMREGEIELGSCAESELRKLALKEGERGA